MELVINIIIYIFTFIGFIVTFITIFGKCVVQEEKIKNKSYRLQKNCINKKYRKIRGDKNVFIFKGKSR